MESAGRDRSETTEPLALASIGPYRLLEVLGEGGMGTVYLAEQQQPLLRRVAVKVVKLGMDSRAVLARFEVERSTRAAMSIRWACCSTSCWSGRVSLASIRELMPPTVAPQDVRSHICRSRRVYSVVHLERASADSVVRSLGTLLADSGGLMHGLTMGSIGDTALGVLGPPEKVAFVLENVRQFEGGGSVR